MTIKHVNAVNKSVLIISDTHIPYQHKDYLKFLTAIKEKYLDKKSLIIHIGDEVDSHAISFHDSDQELFSAGHELSKSIELLAGLNELFPKMLLLESNHGSLIYRRMKHHGIPIRHLKPLHDIYETPKWKWYDEIILKTKHVMDTYLCHGKISGYNRLAREVGMNAIQGHFHGKFEITYYKTPTVERYNMMIGCLIDHESLAFAYGKNHIQKPILGCGFIDKDGNPSLIKMNLNDKGRWNGTLQKI